MAKRESVNVWFDRPGGGFLEIFWGRDDGSGNVQDPGGELDPTVFINSANDLVGFHIMSPLYVKCDYLEETYLFEDCPSHPLTVKYDRAADLWDVQWGPGAVECVDTPNPRIRARVDANGDIQGVLISDLRTFEDEILNQDIYPVKPGAAAT